MIYTCPVCSAMHEMGSDHRNSEPCAACYRKGWRDDGCGNLRQIKRQSQGGVYAQWTPKATRFT